MNESRSPESVSDGNPRWFSTTHWSVVLEARGDSPGAAAALETLCRTYWSPLYTYIRQRGYSLHDAEDLAQQFVMHLLQHDALERVSRQKGKFRSFLLASLNNFLATQFRRATAKKRGGGASVIPLDPAKAEHWFETESAHCQSADTLFERRWALTLFEQALQQLRSEYVAAAKLPQFERLKPFLETKARHGDYESAAVELGTTAANVAVCVHRMKQRYGELLRREVANTVESPDELDDELRYLASVLTR